MKLAQTPAVQQPSTQATTERRGPTLIDPSDFKFVSGGSPRNGWQAADSTSQRLVETQSPRNGW